MWFPLAALPRTAFDHHLFIDAAEQRLRATPSYTNISFALAPTELTIAQLRAVVGGSLGFPVSATNRTRVMTRRAMIEPTGDVVSPARPGAGPPPFSGSAPTR